MKKYDTYVLFLTIKKYWFNKILNGTKNIEYREFKKYYHNKLQNSKYKKLVLQAGYHKNSPKLICDILKITTEELKLKNELFEVKNKYYLIYIENPVLI